MVAHSHSDVVEVVDVFKRNDVPSMHHWKWFYSIEWDATSACDVDVGLFHTRTRTREIHNSNLVTRHNREVANNGFDNLCRWHRKDADNATIVEVHCHKPFWAVDTCINLPISVEVTDNDSLWFRDDYWLYRILFGAVVVEVYNDYVHVGWVEHHEQELSLAICINICSDKSVEEHCTYSNGHWCINLTDRIFEAECVIEDPGNSSTIGCIPYRYRLDKVW